jgi:hypothetical protein
MTDKKVPQALPVTDKSANIKKTEEVVAKKKASIESLLEGTEAGAIWNEIKDKTIELFALPNQTIALHAAPALVEPSKLYLLTRSSSVLTAIETAVGKNYTVELADKYTVVGRAVVPLTRK